MTVTAPKAMETLSKVSAEDVMRMQEIASTIGITVGGSVVLTAFVYVLLRLLPKGFGTGWTGQKIVDVSVLIFGVVTIVGGLVATWLQLIRG